MRIVALLISLLVGTAHCFALDVHADYRYAFGACPTWGTGMYSEVQAYMRIKETWDTMVSNYPIGWVASAGQKDCRYKGQPAPMAKPGEYVVPGNLCKPKTVIPNVCANDMHTKCHVAADCPGSACVPGTMPATSYPWSYIAISADYNGGGTSFPSGCTWDPWAYGAPPSP